MTVAAARKTSKSSSPASSATPQSIAWCGWRLHLPDGWRPLKIDGTHVRGMMMLGMAERPMVQVKWWRPWRKNFSGDKWIRKRLKVVNADPEKVRSSYQAEDFTDCVWIPDAGGDKDASAKRGLWYGYAEHRNLVLELVVYQASKPRGLRKDVREVLRSIALADVGEETLWAVFHTSFRAPRRFELESWRLHLGDMLLTLVSHRGERALLRQVYPAKLALDRRPMEKWMQRWPKRDRRHYRADDEPRAHTFDRDGEAIEGVVVDGMRRYRFPLGWMFPRTTRTAAAHDEANNRLLIVELDTRGKPKEGLLDSLVTGMNRGGGLEHA